MKPIEKIQIAVSALNIISTSLSHTHHQIATINPKPEYLEEMLDDQDKVLKTIAEKVTQCANEMADYMNGTDAVDEELLEIVNPMFELINRDNLKNLY